MWLFEIADLSNIRKAEVETLKRLLRALMTELAPHMVVSADFPRRGVIWATTNNSEYLKSQTGNRRFWPIEVAVTRPIDIECLTRDRDQLFAEACQYG